MNIKQAKEYIKNSINIYLKKDEFGDYRIPVVRQRPIFLLGAPGIGKTAIMEQIAEELNIALVSYSMTHHTRQSALGLPFIKEKKYGNKDYNVSEYTMSEIIASIYETMEESQVREGILFLDEINCVSETLAPSMLQFLQYKVFGKHAVPEGWVIVTAGNPPEYNKSAREFDVVTLDRLKVLNVEADYSAWKEYAISKGIHNSIMSFLELKKEYFYHMETTAKGRLFVTARGWEDLSEIITMYEEENLKVDEALVEQYIRSELLVKEFCAYYDLYNKYKNDYRIDEILNGKVMPDMINKAKNAPFDEKLSLLGMLLDKALNKIKDVVETSDYLKELIPHLKLVKSSESVYDMLELQRDKRIKIVNSKEKANSLSQDAKRMNKRIIAFLDDARKDLITQNITGDAFSAVKNKYDVQIADMKENVCNTHNMLHNLFGFVEQAFESGNEMLILVTELTVSKYSTRFISAFGCEDYDKYQQMLMISARQNDMRELITSLDI